MAIFDPNMANSKLVNGIEELERTTIRNKYEILKDPKHTIVVRYGSRTIIPEDKIDDYCYTSTTLYRIRALKDFGDVKAGDIGGFIEKERNLSQCGTCWVYDNAMVYGNAYVNVDAKIQDYALVMDDAHVTDGVDIAENAIICDNASIGAYATVHEDAKVRGDAVVRGEAIIHGHAIVEGSVWIGDNAEIDDHITIRGDVSVEDDAFVSGTGTIAGRVIIKGNAQVSIFGTLDGHHKIGDDAYVIGPEDVLSVGPIGTRNDITTFYRNDVGDIRVICGCFQGTLKEFETRVKTKYEWTDNHYRRFRKEYLAAIKLAKVCLKRKR